MELQNVIKWMMHPNHEHRPTVDALLAVPQIQRILKRRRLMKPIMKIVSESEPIFMSIFC